MSLTTGNSEPETNAESTSAIASGWNEAREAGQAANAWLPGLIIRHTWRGFSRHVNDRNLRLGLRAESP